MRIAYSGIKLSREKKILVNQKQNATGGDYVYIVPQQLASMTSLEVTTYALAL